MKLNKKRKLNLFDLAIILIGLLTILAAGSVLALKVLKVETPGVKKQSVEITVKGPRLDPSVAAGIKIGDPLVMKQSGVLVGKIKRVQVDKAREVVTTWDGRLILSTSPYHEDIFLTVESAAVNADDGIKVGGSSIKINQEEQFITRKTSFMGRFWKIAEIR